MPGLETACRDPIGFEVHHLNHLATQTLMEVVQGIALLSEKAWILARQY